MSDMPDVSKPAETSSSAAAATAAAAGKVDVTVNVAANGACTVKTAVGGKVDVTFLSGSAATSGKDNVTGVAYSDAVSHAGPSNDPATRQALFDADERRILGLWGHWRAEDQAAPVYLSGANETNAMANDLGIHQSGTMVVHAAADLNEQPERTNRFSTSSASSSD